MKIYMSWCPNWVERLNRLVTQPRWKIKSPYADWNTVAGEPEMTEIAGWLGNLALTGIQSWVNQRWRRSQADWNTVAAGCADWNTVAGGIRDDRDCRLTGMQLTGILSRMRSRAAYNIGVPLHSWSGTVALQVFEVEKAACKKSQLSYRLFGPSMLFCPSWRQPSI